MKFRDVEMKSDKQEVCRHRCTRNLENIDLFLWFQITNQLSENSCNVNTAKCKVMYLGKNNLGTTYTFNVGQVQTDLEKVIAESDLGVKFDNKLSFTYHISEITLSIF